MSFPIWQYGNVFSRLELLFPIIVNDSNLRCYLSKVHLPCTHIQLVLEFFSAMLYSMRSNMPIELMTHLMFHFFPRIMSRKPFIFLSNFSFQLSLWFSACSCEQVHSQKVQSYICGASSKALRTLFLVNKWDNIDASCHLHQDIWHFKLLIPI